MEGCRGLGGGVGYTLGGFRLGPRTANIYRVFFFFVKFCKSLSIAYSLQVPEVKRFAAFTLSRDSGRLPSSSKEAGSHTVTGQGASLCMNRVGSN
jgi:hypothetical protein